MTALRLTMILLLAAGGLQAQLATWDFEGETTSASSTAAGVTAGNAAFGSGLQNKIFSSGNGSTDAYSADHWTTDDDDYSSSDYIQFSLSGECLDITSLSWSERRSNSGVRKYKIRYSTNGFSSSSSLASGSIADNDSWRTHTTTLALSDITQIAFRIYGYDSESHSGTWRFDDVSINGSACSNGPPNDHCENAEVITAASGEVCGTTIDADADEPNDGDYCDGDDSDAHGHGVWYTFVGDGDVWTFNFPEDYPGWDPEVNIYSGVCGEYTCVAGDDDGGGPGYSAYISFETTPGTTYFIYVHPALESCSAESDFCFTVETDGEDCDVAITDVSATPENCPDADDGSITVTASTSTGPLTYSISGPVNESNSTGIFTGLPDGDYDIEVSDDGLEECSATSSASVAAGVDITPPAVYCPEAPITLYLDAACAVVLPDYTGYADASDNCDVASVTQSPVAGTILSGAGSQTVTLTATDVNGNMNDCNFTVNKVDNTPPSVACSNHSVVFDGESTIALNKFDLISASDNCGAVTTSISPAVISCEQLGQTVPVTATATDGSGNVNSCTSYITVTGLPCGWSQGTTDDGCDGAWTYNTNTEVFSGASSDCYYASSFDYDELSLARHALCGDGEIIAQVTGITGATPGWAGVCMRENGIPGAKKVQLMTNLSNYSRREVRYTTGGTSFPQQFPGVNRYWLRLVRQGNQFIGYTSSNGVQWYQVMAVTVAMNSCIDMDLVVTNHLQTGDINATFAHVSVSGSGGAGLSVANNPGAVEAQAPIGKLQVYPNPTTGEVTVQLPDLINEQQTATLTVMDLYGRILSTGTLDALSDASVNCDLSQMPSGVYFLHLRMADGQKWTQRVVVQPRQ